MRKPAPFLSVLLLVLTIPVFAFPQIGETGGEILPGLIEDVKRLEKMTNIARLESIKAMLSERDIPYEIELFSQDKNKNYPRSEGVNVIITMGSQKKEIILGAHWDAPWIDKNVLSGGIIDNGCSVIILMRIAEELQKMNLNHRIRIVFFDMEEIGLLGSKAYVAKHKNDNIQFMINLDVCGAGNTLIFGNRKKAEGNPIFTALKNACVEEDINFVEFPRFYACDEIPFQSLGIKGIMISLAPEIDAHLLWLKLNGPEGGGSIDSYWPTKYIKSIHSKDDTSEMADPVGMTFCFRAVLETVIRLDRN